MQQASNPSDAASSQVSQHEEMMKAPAALSRSCFLGQTSIRMDCWRTRDWKRINQFSVFVRIFCLLGWYRQISIDFKFGNEKFFFSTLFKWSSFVGARKSIRCSSATSCHPLFSQQIPKKRHRADDLAHERTAWPTSEASLHRLYYDYLSYRPHADDGDALLRRHSRRRTATLRQECHFDARQDRPLRSLDMGKGPTVQLAKLFWVTKTLPMRKDSFPSSTAPTTTWSPLRARQEKLADALTSAEQGCRGASVGLNSFTQRCRGAGITTSRCFTGCSTAWFSGSFSTELYAKEELRSVRREAVLDQ